MIISVHYFDTQGWLGGEFWQKAWCNLYKKVPENQKNMGKISPDELKKYFDNWKETIEGVPPQNILNYDETNITDDTGSN